MQTKRNKNRHNMRFQKGHKTNVGRKRQEITKQKIRESLIRRKIKLGFFHSPEARAKMRLSHRGKQLSTEHKLKIGLGNKGKRLSEKTKEKMSIYAKNRTSEHIAKLSGSGNGSWKGGIIPASRKIRNSLKYANWRLLVFERDEFLCQMPDCDKTERSLDSHHIKKFSIFPDLRLDLNNGITLCKKCHNKTKNKEEEFEQLFTEIIIWKNSK